MFRIRRKPQTEDVARKRHTHLGLPLGWRRAGQEVKVTSPRVRSRLPRLHDVGATVTLGPLLDQAARDPLPEDFFDFLSVLGTGNYGKVLGVDLMMIMMMIMTGVMNNLT